ncbi:MAG: hypothetical protein EXS01_06135 [Phycisphaerales bacterium]|nr:hypothetical protein [Phycisphaerales bacterium]
MQEFDDESKDEDPTAEDQRRFSRPINARCSDCGAEIFDDADICPRCHCFLWDGSGAARARAPGTWRRISIVLMVIAALALTGLLAVMVR